MSHVLLCDFTFGSYIKLALGQPGRRPGPATLHACADRDAFDREVLGFLKERGDPKLLGCRYLLARLGTPGRAAVARRRHNAYS